MMSRHGGERQLAAARLGCRPGQLLDASASLVPWSARLPRFLAAEIRHYPDRHHHLLRCSLAALHRLDPDAVLVGNGAAELFTWAGRDATACGLSVLSAPGFADYARALSCWQGALREQPLLLQWGSGFPQSLPDPGPGEVLWLCNPHNPTGQLWSRDSLEPLLQRFSLVICDEAFLPLVPDGEQQSLIALVAEHPNLVVIRSLTKLYGIAGLRLGYAVAHPERLQRWANWRDPWPVNGVALAVGEHLLADPARHQRWCARVQRWTAREGAWLQDRVQAIAGLTPMASAANYLLIQGERSLVPLREAVEQRHRVLLRDCRSFSGLGDTWLRIGLQSRRGNRRIIRALRQELARRPLD